MPRAGRALLLLHPDPVLRETVLRAVSRDFEIILFRDWAALGAFVEEKAPSALVLVDPYLGAEPGDGPSPDLRRFLFDFPFTTVVAAIRIPPGRYDDVRILGRWGVHEVLSLEQEHTPEGVAQRLKQASTRLSEALLRGILDVIPGAHGREILSRAVEHAARKGPAEDLAAELGVNRRTLLRWCNAEGLPAPRRLLAWIRVLMAAHMLEDPRRPVSSIAHLSGYTSDNALRTTLQTFLGKTPKELRQGAAFRIAADAFRAELLALRGSAWRAPDADDARH